MHDTVLSRHVWGLKDSHTEYDLKWRIIKRKNACKVSLSRGNLCFTEKLCILCLLAEKEI